MASMDRASGDGVMIMAKTANRNAAIRQLPKIDAALALMHLDGLSYQEMAEVVGISENYIGVKLNRIRHQIADQLKGANNEL